MTELPMTELMQALVPVLGRALLHFLWQGTVIGLVAAVLAYRSFARRVPLWL